MIEFRCCPNSQRRQTTVLSGEIGTPGDNGDSAYHVVNGSGTDATAVLDGFTVTAGNADGSGWPSNCGGGMFNHQFSYPQITNCILWGNTATSGAQIYNVSSTPTVTYSDVQGGYAGTGNIDADPLFGDWSEGWTFTVSTSSPGGFTIYLPVLAREYRLE